MASFVRLDPERAEIEPGRRIISEEDYALRVAAQDLLTEAEAEAARIVEEAKQAYEAEKERGFQEGMANAQVEIAEQMLTIVTRSVDYLATAEGAVAKTVMICLRKILGDFPEEDTVVLAARNALQVVRNEERVTVAVRPKVQDEVRARIGEILKDSGDIGFIEVVGDKGLPKGGCRLQTEIGVVDASIDQQIEAIERAMRDRLKSK